MWYQLLFTPNFSSLAVLKFKLVSDFFANKDTALSADKNHVSALKYFPEAEINANYALVTSKTFMFLSAILLLLLVWHAPLGVRSAKRRHQSPEWTILSHSYRLIQ